jgi:Uma2 family endonuclease
MATVTPTPAPASSPAQAPAEPARGDQRVEFIGIGWEGYLALLKVQGERSRPQIIYLNGDAYLVSPSNIHERFGKRLGMFVMIIVEELDIPCEATGETTFHRHDEDAGVQPDESFYLANFRSIAAKDGKEDIYLDVDPPPDLVIEVVHTHPATKAVEVLRRLGVPEVWVCNKEGLSFLIRKKNGRYVEAKRSLSFPFLTAAEIFDWVNRPGMASMTHWVKELRQWVKDVLVPRVRGEAG